jgi:hypothetical protein
MDNPFGAPAAAQQPAPAPAPAPGIGVPPASAAQALAGLNEAAIETRLPFMPADSRGRLKIDTVRLVNGQKIGVAFFIEGTVLETADPRVTVGGQYAFKIDGFQSVTAKKFAMSDLKAFMCVALAQHGCTPAFAGDWIGAAVQMAERNLAEGAVVDYQTSLTAPGKDSGKTKIKTIWSVAA